MAVRLLTMRAGRALLPKNIIWYSFLLEAEWTPGPSAAERIRYIGQRINGLTGTRTLSSEIALRDRRSATCWTVGRLLTARLTKEKAEHEISKCYHNVTPPSVLQLLTNEFNEFLYTQQNTHATVDSHCPSTEGGTIEPKQASICTSDFTQTSKYDTAMEHTQGPKNFLSVKLKHSEQRLGYIFFPFRPIHC
jgi:hypothetical protein